MQIKYGYAGTQSDVTCAQEAQTKSEYGTNLCQHKSNLTTRCSGKYAGHAPARDLHPDALLSRHLRHDSRNKASHGRPRVDDLLALAEGEAVKSELFCNCSGEMLGMPTAST
jgi:hypothetical protein